MRTFFLTRPQQLHPPPHTLLQLFCDLCNKGRLVATWDLGEHGRSTLLPHCDFSATVGVRRAPAAGASTQDSSAPCVVSAEGGGSSVRDAKEHAAALASEQLLRRLSDSGASVETVWGKILSQAPDAIQAYSRRLASNLILARQQGTVMFQAAPTEALHEAAAPLRAMHNPPGLPQQQQQCDEQSSGTASDDDDDDAKRQRGASLPPPLQPWQLQVRPRAQQRMQLIWFQYMPVWVLLVFDRVNRHMHLCELTHSSLLRSHQ